MRLIVFSSPLHFLVALLVKQSDGVESVGLYLRHQKDCSETFAKIAEKLGVDLRYVTSMESLDQNFSEVVITNRFDPVQVALIEKYRRKATIAFMEEGASIYLKELHFSKGLSDGNRWLRLKELFRVVIGKGRRFIPMSWFEKGYSFCAAEIPFLSKRCELINLTDVFRATVRNSNIDKSGGGKKIIILSQWFVAKQILSEDEMLAFYGWLVERKLSGYDAVYYKPHPWDEVEFTDRVKQQFGFLSVEDEDLPVELWLALNPNADLIGFWTSTMFYCDGVLPNKAFSALKALSKYSNNENIVYQYKIAEHLILNSGVEEVPSD